MSPETACELASSAVSFAADQCKIAIMEAAGEYARPCVVHRPKLSLDGDQYCVLLGDNLQEGVAGFGNTVAEAMFDFDIAFFRSTAPRPQSGKPHYQK